MVPIIGILKGDNARLCWCGSERTSKKRCIFLDGEVFFLLTCPLMGDLMIIALTANLYTILQILSVTIFGRIPLIQVVTESNYKNKPSNPFNQLNLFDNLTGH